MNFYKHYIGDFQRDTGHLSLTERGAYLCLMHHYYATEKPLPDDYVALCRIAGAVTKVERDAVRVAMGFFEATERGGVHKRIEAELAKAAVQADTNRRIAQERESKRKGTRTEHEQSTKRATDRSTNLEPNHNQSQGSTETYSVSSDLLQPTSGCCPQSKPGDPCPHQQIISLYHDILPELPRVKVWDERRMKILRARWRETPDLEEFEAMFRRVKTSKFLTGKTNGSQGRPPFVADLEWLLNPSNQTKIVEGKFHRG